MHVQYDGDTTIVSGDTTLVDPNTQLKIVNAGRTYSGGIVGGGFRYRAAIAGHLTGLIELRRDSNSDDLLLDSIVFGVEEEAPDAADDEADEPVKKVVKRPAKAAAKKK